jgi:phage-related protein
MGWIVETLNEIIDDELARLPVDMRAKFSRIAFLIESVGLERMREPYVKHLDGELWEIRISGKDGIARAIYITITGKRVIVLRVFIKKTQKTPRHEIELSLERAKRIIK